MEREECEPLPIFTMSVSPWRSSTLSCCGVLWLAESELLLSDFLSTSWLDMSGLVAVRRCASHCFKSPIAFGTRRPDAMVCAFGNSAADFSPASNARTMGAQPLA